MFKQRTRHGVASNTVTLWRRRRRLTALVGCAVAVLSAPLSWKVAIADPPPPGSFVVNTTAVSPDVSPGDGQCLTAAGVCSLPAAIAESNADASFNEIRFDIPAAELETGTGRAIINRTTSFPALTAPVLIDGSSQPGYAGEPLVVLRGPGSGCTNAAHVGITLQGSGSTVRALALTRWCIGVRTAGTGGHAVEGNWFGNDGHTNLSIGHGVHLAGGNNRVGGTDPGQRNVFTGALEFEGALKVTSSNNVVQGNWFGAHPKKTTPVPNFNSIFLQGSDNLIGGNEPAERNLISGSTRGIFAWSGANHRIQGNWIGTDPTGTEDWGNTAEGLQIFSSIADLQLGGTAPGEGNVIVGSDATGVLLLDPGRVVMQGNFIGLAPDGVHPIPNIRGVLAFQGNQPKPASILGGTEPGARNVISGNHIGVDVHNPRLVIQGNFIGTDATGTGPVPNFNGIDVNTSTLTIGGVQAGAGNVISGNRDYGVRIGPEFSSTGQVGTKLLGNRIGTDLTGLSALGNGSGVFSRPGLAQAVIGGTDGVTPGGPCTGACNLISGNRNHGLVLLGNDHVVKGNFFGTDITGNAPLPNTHHGLIVAEESKRAVFGGTEPAARNVFSGNGSSGLLLRRFVEDARVEGNYMGVGADGVTPVGNGGAGVLLGQPIRRAVIGGTTPGTGNVIAYNGDNGIRVSAVINEPQTNSFLGNSIDVNGSLGIDHANFGIPAANRVPVLSQAEATGPNQFTIAGHISDPALNNAVRRIEVFSSPTCDPSGFGEGHTFLGATTLSGGTFSLVVPTPPEPVITATMTLNTGETSEFSQCLPQPPPTPEFGFIEIEKQTVPDGSTEEFQFGGVPDGQELLSDGEVIRFQVAAGRHVVSEVGEEGWATRIECDDPTDDTRPALGPNSMDIGVAPDETVHCTFTNTKLAVVTIEKDTIRGGGTFQFSGVLGGFSLTDDGVQHRQTFLTLAAGKVVEEPAGGWALEGIDCGEHPAAAVDVADRSVSLTPQPADVIHCTFTNRRETGFIEIEKQTVPDGAPDRFTFEGLPAGQSTLGDGETVRFEVFTGLHEVKEQVPAGWAAPAVDCVDPSGGSGTGETPNVAFLAVAKDETVHCTFTNTRADGFLVIEKRTIPDLPPGAGPSFEFEVDGAKVADLRNEEVTDPIRLVPGSRTVDELVPARWRFVRAECSVGGEPSTVQDVVPFTVAIQRDTTTHCVVTNERIQDVFLSTQAPPSVPSGGMIHDTATLTGGVNPTGTITFQLFGPDDALCQTPIATSTATVAGPGAYTSSSYRATAPGTYRWIASYSGDVDNNAVPPGDCDDPAEQVTVTSQLLTGRAFGLELRLRTLLGGISVGPLSDTGPVSTTVAQKLEPPCVAQLSLLLVRGRAVCASLQTAQSPSSSAAKASLADVSVGSLVPGLPVISVKALHASSRTDCTGSTGATVIEQLRIGGTLRSTVNVAPNTVIRLPLGAKLILNEQKPIPGGLEVNALHLVAGPVLGTKADLVIASATSDIHNCP